MSTIARGRTFINPLLQSLLLQSMEKVKESLDNKDYFSAWERVKTLHIICPPPIRREVQPEIDDLIMKINQNIREGRDDLDLYIRVYSQNNQVSILLRNNVWRIFLSITDKLYAGGYMENVSEFRKGHELDY